jgi:hypothetical protein
VRAIVEVVLTFEGCDLSKFVPGYESGTDEVFYFREIDLPFPPYAGMTLHFSDEGLQAAGIDAEWLQVTVQRADWWEGTEDEEAHLTVHTDPIDFDPVASRAELVARHQYMLASGFETEEGDEINRLVKGG